MTKEQILGNYYREHTDTEKAIYEAMEHYKEQELTAEREKAAKLAEALDKALKFISFYEGEQDFYNEIKSVLNEVQN